MTAASFLRHLLFCAGLAALSATVVVAMMRLRVLDHPDAGRPDARRAHTLATPKGGGVGIVAAFMVGIAALYEFAQFSRLADGYFIGLILASGAIAAVAFLDDLRDWPFAIKLAAQVAAAAAALATGLYVSVYRLPYIGAEDIGWWGILPSLFWILFATNAMNFIDGLNGLASGVALIACVFLAAIGAAQQAWFVYFAALLLGAGIVGFLPFNFPRARIFMGDVGSQFCGFVLAVLGIAASRFDGVTLSFAVVPLLAVRRAVRCGVHPGSPHPGGAAHHRGASGPSVPDRPPRRHGCARDHAGALGVRCGRRRLLRGVPARRIGMETGHSAAADPAAAGVACGGGAACAQGGAGAMVADRRLGRRESQAVAAASSDVHDDYMTEVFGIDPRRYGLQPIVAQPGASPGAGAVSGAVIGAAVGGAAPPPTAKQAEVTKAADQVAKLSDADLHKLPTKDKVALLTALVADGQPTGAALAAQKKIYLDTDLDPAFKKPTTPTATTSPRCSRATRRWRQRATAGPRRARRTRSPRSRPWWRRRARNTASPRPKS